VGELRREGDEGERKSARPLGLNFCSRRSIWQGIKVNKNTSQAENDRNQKIHIGFKSINGLLIVVVSSNFLCIQFPKRWFF
jgi:hypothetical protein